MLPKITIVTPSFNQGRYLEQTICSVLDQHYPKLEYFVMDGGSTDCSLAIIKKYARHLAGWVSEKDRGQAHAVNKGLTRATGEIHGYLNSDDLYEPGALRAIGEAFAEGQRQWVVGQVRNFSEGQDDTITTYPHDICDNDQWFWFFANPVHQPGAFWHKRLFERFGGFKETLRYVFDYDMFMRFRFYGGFSPVPIPSTVAAFRLHGDSKTISEGHLFEEEFASVRREIMQSLSSAERRAARKRVRWLCADYLQARALQSNTAGRVPEAWTDFWRSLRLYPSMALQRRTAGCLKRLMLSRHAMLLDG